MSFSRYQLFLRFLLPLALVLLAALAIPALIDARAQQPTATYTHGNLSVTLPYHSTRAGSGKLTTQILDPEDHILGQVERAVDIAKGDGAWQQVITPEKVISFEDIVWQRVRYRFEYNDGDNLPAMEGIEPISEILRRPVVRILGETRYLAGSQAAIRVIVSDATNNDVSETGTIHIELLLPDQKKLPLFSGRLNRRGTLEAQFHFPTGLTGKYEMHYIADTPIGSTEYTQALQLEDTASILLTTEKPLYQPGQTIHVRALAPGVPSPRRLAHASRSTSCPPRLA
jgi:hypothetical protein